jgi:hypothetical protein
MYRGTEGGGGGGAYSARPERKNTRTHSRARLSPLPAVRRPAPPRLTLPRRMYQQKVVTGAIIAVLVALILLVLYSKFA